MYMIHYFDMDYLHIRRYIFRANIKLQQGFCCVLQNFIVIDLPIEQLRPVYPGTQLQL